MVRFLTASRFLFLSPRARVRRRLGLVDKLANPFLFFFFSFSAFPPLSPAREALFYGMEVVSSSSLFTDYEGPLKGSPPPLFISLLWRYRAWPPRRALFFTNDVPSWPLAVSLLWRGPWPLCSRSKRLFPSFGFSCFPPPLLGRLIGSGETETFPSLFLPCSRFP